MRERIMPSPTKILPTTKVTSPTNRRYNPQCRHKPWFACIAIAVVLLYVLALVFIGRLSAEDESLMIAITSTDEALASINGSTAPPTLNHAENTKKGGRNSGIQPSAYHSIARDIAARWNLASPEAPYLLERQFYRTSDYDPQIDFLHFHHIPKTGGTTLSDIINATLGASIDGHRGVLPGSQKSGSTDPKMFYKLTGITPNSTTAGNTTVDFPYVASYGHTRLRPIHGPNKTALASFFEEYFALPNNSQKRLRSLAMLREPMDLRASTYAMGMCALNGRVNQFNKNRTRHGLEQICTPEQGLNISSFHDEVVEEALAKCPNGTKGIDASTSNNKLNRNQKILCNRGAKALDLCRSPKRLLQTWIYKNNLRSMMKGLMGRYVGAEGIDSHLYAYVEDLAKRTGMKFSLEDVEEYTLIDLGGLDSNIKHTPYTGYASENAPKIDNDAEPDFLWFGLTERMKESTCLFYHTLRAKPIPKTPRHRVMKCATTSWWTEEDRASVKKNEAPDYSVWRAANAIMDVRVLKMQDDIRSNLENIGGLSRDEIEQYQALAGAGCMGPIL